MIELPRTLEEITVWKLEHADLISNDNSRASYFNLLFRAHTPELYGPQVQQQLLAWLESIVHLEGIVTLEPAHRDYSPKWYRVRVAGIRIFTISHSALDRISGVAHD
jgi:hypothetical protein